MSRAAILGVLCAAGWALPTVTTIPDIWYRCEGRDSALLTDSGRAKLHARLVRAHGEQVQDVVFRPGKVGVWCALLRDGVQIKGIAKGSDRFTAEGEMPIVLDRGADYEIDYAGGLAKALPGGRVEAGATYLVELTYTNDGPMRVATKGGMSLLFDGRDDYAECRSPRLRGLVREVRVRLRFKLLATGGSSPVLVSFGEATRIGVEGRDLVLRHAGLRASNGKGARETRAAACVTVGTWHSLDAGLAAGKLSIRLDGREVASRSGLAGSVPISDTLRLGGVRDPHFFGGLMDDVRVSVGWIGGQ